MYSRVLLKLSGEAIAAKDFPFSVEVLDDIASQVKKIVEEGTKVAIVVGGGNICRGRMFEQLGFDRVESDYTGMLATVINAKFVAESIEKTGIKAKALSAVKAQGVEDYSVELANKLFDEGYVLVFGGGVGKPYHSTDTGSAQRAIDIKAEIILMAKSGVDGVYNSDPKTNPEAKKYDTLTFKEIIENDLKVIDLQAAKLCQENNVKAFVFNMLDKDNIVKAAKGQAIGTIIHN